MGLDLRLLVRDPDRSARWSYGGFAAFRNRVAAEIGVDMETMLGFGGDTPWSTVDDPLVVLLNHSDCEGEFDYEACHTLAPRLREFVAGWPEDDYDREQALRLCEMMDAVVEGDAERVLFE